MDAHKLEIGEQPAMEKHRTWRVWLIIALLVLLVAQGAIDGLFRISGHNAFPTIAMPGFGANNIGTNGRALVTVRHIDLLGLDDSEQAVAPEALLAPMLTASAIATLDRIFQPSADIAPTLEPKTIEYLRHQCLQIGTNFVPVGLRLTWQTERFDVRSLKREPVGPATVREITW